MSRVPNAEVGIQRNGQICTPVFVDTDAFDVVVWSQRHDLVNIVLAAVVRFVGRLQ